MFAKCANSANFAGWGVVAELHGREGGDAWRMAITTAASRRGSGPVRRVKGMASARIWDRGKRPQLALSACWMALGTAERRSTTRTPAASSAMFFSAAVPVPPEMMAPA